MALPDRSDVPFLLSRIRPGAAWGWKGGKKNDKKNVRWRDGGQVEPSEAEYLAEQAVVDAEVTAEAATVTAQQARAVGLVGKPANLMAQPDQSHAIEEILRRLGGIDINGNIRPMDEWSPGPL
jgi:hypothetical protein